MKRAQVIVFDGPDGVGKSTQILLAKEALESHGFKVHTARVPGGTPIGEELRKAILSDLERPPETDLHVIWGVMLALARDIEAKAYEFDYILVDRGPFAFIAYQVYGSGLNKQIAMIAVKDIMAKWKTVSYFVFMAPLDVTRARLAKESKKTDYFESKGDRYHLDVIEGYESVIDQFEPIVIDARPDAKTVHQTVMKHIVI